MSTIQRVVSVVGDLLAGRQHDRHSISRAIGIELAAADRYIRELEKLPEFRVIYRGRTKLITYQPPLAPWPKRPT